MATKYHFMLQYKSGINVISSPVFCLLAFYCVLIAFSISIFSSIYFFVGLLILPQADTSSLVWIKQLDKKMY